MSPPVVRRARDCESAAVAALFRLSKEAALPYLPDLHTPEEDRVFFREHVFATCDVWVAECAGVLVGFCAFREGWIDLLYVHPVHLRTGIGTALLRTAMNANAQLRLWTFQRNEHARVFYEAHGFTCVKTTDGHDNEEHEPDALYMWSSSNRISLVSSKPRRS
jgi:GNAT superfamily N-acetyltransferase